MYEDQIYQQLLNSKFHNSISIMTNFSLQRHWLIERFRILFLIYFLFLYFTTTDIIGIFSNSHSLLKRDHLKAFCVTIHFKIIVQVQSTVTFELWNKFKITVLISTACVKHDLDIYNEREHTIQTTMNTIICYDMDNLHRLLKWLMHFKQKQF